MAMFRVGLSPPPQFAPMMIFLLGPNHKPVTVQTAEVYVYAYFLKVDMEESQTCFYHVILLLYFISLRNTHHNIMLTHPDWL